MKVERAQLTLIFFLQGLLVFLMAGSLTAQAPGTGAITGQVFDPSGAVIGNARVTAVSDETGSSRTATTTAEGVFSVPLLPPGDYSLIVSASGFQSKTLRSIHVNVTETAVVNVKLEVASAASTKIEVSASLELAQTESSTLGRVTDQSTIVSLPLANRNFSQILALSPGVEVGVPQAGALGRNTQNVSADGAKTTSNNFQFNGVDANNISQNSFASASFYPEVGIAVPATDTIAEFKVQTGMYDADYGRGAGANIDFVSRTGTNNFHGDLWEFFRNSALDANDYFLKQSQLKAGTSNQPPVFKQNQFGGAFGGPIRKNRTFFFASYQTTIQRDGDDQSVSLVSTFLPPLTNDRSKGGLGAAFCSANHPGDSFYQTAAGGAQVDCSGSNLNPVAVALLSAKLPNGSYAIPTPQSVSGDIGQSVFSIPAQYREDQFSVNLDHRVSDQNQLAGRFFYSRSPITDPFTPFAATVPGFGTIRTERNDMFVLSDTHAFSSNLINMARFGFMRFDGDQNTVTPMTGAAVGMQTAPGRPEIPGISVLGLFSIGPPFQSSYFENTNTFVWQDTVSLTRGRHNLRMGAEAKRHQLDPSPSAPAGFLFFLSFPDFLLGESAAQNGSPTGQSNVFNSAGGSGIFRKDERYTDYASFVQDDFKVSTRLTVNAGLRYEYFGPPTEIRGRLTSFDPAIATPQVPLTGSLSGFVVPANFQGPVPAGVTKSNNSGLWDSDYKDLGPRFGFALRLHDSPAVVLRGGYGIYYERLSGQPASETIGQPPFSFTQSLQGAGNGAATLQEPFNPPLPPLSAYPLYIPRMAATTNTPGSALFVQSISQNVTSPYTQQYDLNVQYEFAPNFLWQVGYVGSKATHLGGCVEFNQALIATPQNPVNGQSTTSAANVAVRVPYEGIAGGSFFCSTEFEANYNSLQTSVTKRLSHGLELQAGYTFSRNLDFTSGTGGLDSLDLSFLGNDQTKPQQSHGLNDFDRTHRFVLSFVYRPPRLESGPRLLRHAVSQWQFSGLSVLQSGLPITVIDSGAGTAYGNLTGMTRAECTGANPASSGSLTGRLNGYFNPAAFAAPPLIGDGTVTDFGNCGVGILRGPSQRDLDLGIQRSFPVTETSSLQFRAEFFNFTNTPKFGAPVNDHAAGPGVFGVISSSASNPRIMQFALKLNF